MKRKLVSNDAAPAAGRVLQRITLNVGGNKHRLRREKLEGRTHLVVPTVMMTEGVHVGNNGAGYYPADELARVVNDWNHMPVVVYHPEDGESARTKNVINTRKVGVVLNSKWNGKQKTEVWLDVARAGEIDGRIIEKLDKGEKVEVSTGVYLNMEQTPGKWGTEKYDWVARDHRPDHLAILPDRVGACSIKDGAGMLQFNEAAREPEGSWGALRRGVENALKAVGVSVTANEMSFSDVTVTLNDLLAARYGEKGKYWRGYVCAVYDDYVVFCNAYDDPKMYRVAYTKADGVVKLSGDAQEVSRTVEYTPTGAKLAANEAPRKKKSRAPVLNHSETPMDKDTLISELVANGGFEEADRDWLKAKSVDQLKKLKPQKAESAKAETPAQTKNETPTQGQPVTPLTMEQAKALLPPEFWAVHNQGQKALDAQRQAYITVIKNAGEANKFSDAQLAAFPPDTLAAMAELARASAKPTENESGFRDGWTPDYTLASGPAPTTNQRVGDETPLKFETPKFPDPRTARAG